MTHACGDCTVLLNGSRAKSCLEFAANGAAIVTTEGLAPEGALTALQQAHRGPDPRGPARDLCRCTGHESIVDAVLAAAETPTDKGEAQ